MTTSEDASLSSDHLFGDFGPEALEQTERLWRFANELGYTEAEPPQSILDVLASAGRESGAQYVPALRRAHQIGLLSDEMSSHAVDSLRALLESTQDREKPFYQLAHEWQGDIAADTVLARWNDLECLLGISSTTSRSSLAADERQPRGQRQVAWPDRIKAGAIAFEGQGGGGPWGAGTTW